MKNIKIYDKQNVLISDQNHYEDPNEFVDHIVSTNYFGLPERWVREAYLVTGIENEESILFYPDETYEESEVLDRREELLFPETENLETVKQVLLPAEYTIEIEDITESLGKSNCKTKAKELIRDLDWVIDEETSPKLLNKSEFIAYRSALRSLIINPQTDPSWPPRPQEVWEA